MYITSISTPLAKSPKESITKEQITCLLGPGSICGAYIKYGSQLMSIADTNLRGRVCWKIYCKTAVHCSINFKKTRWSWLSLLYRLRRICKRATFGLRLCAHIKRLWRAFAANTLRTLQPKLICVYFIEKHLSPCILFQCSLLIYSCTFYSGYSAGLCWRTEFIDKIVQIEVQYSREQQIYEQQKNRKLSYSTGTWPIFCDHRDGTAPRINKSCVQINETGNWSTNNTISYAA